MQFISQIKKYGTKVSCYLIKQGNVMRIYFQLIFKTVGTFINVQMGLKKSVSYANKVCTQENFIQLYI